MVYDQATVRRALVSLREQDLARVVHRPGDRVAKHAHRLDESLGLDTVELAVLALLLLRGPQTPGELRARADRMHSFRSPAEVLDVLTGLAERAEGALVAPLERRAGQKEARCVQLLSDEAPEPSQPAPTRDHGDDPADAVARIAEDVEHLRAEVAELRARLDAGS